MQEDQEKKAKMNPLQAELTKSKTEVMKLQTNLKDNEKKLSRLETKLNFQENQNRKLIEEIRLLNLEGHDSKLVGGETNGGSVNRKFDKQET